MGFRLANRLGRACLVGGDGLFDLEHVTGGGFGSEPMEAIARQRELHSVSAGLDGPADHVLDPTQLGPPVPRPSKIFAVGLNYPEHAKETGAEIPAVPLVFAKFPNCLAGPAAEVVVPDGAAVDWEAELVVVIGDRCRDVPETDAWNVIAGICVGIDISDRVAQFAASPPHFDLGKSWDGFGPIGPAVTSPDLVADPNDLAITCDVNGERMQADRTSSMFHPVGALVAHISRFCTLEPGDLLFTGTPAGVGAVQGRFLHPGDIVVASIEHVGSITTTLVDGPRR